MTEARRLHLPDISVAVRPAVPRSTRKPTMPSSARAQTTATSAMDPFVIHRLVPEITQSPPSRRAALRIPPGFEPKSGSVSAKQPIASPRPSTGSHRALCSSEPNRWIANIVRAP